MNNIGLMPEFEERYNKIISNYSEAKNSGDKNLLNEVIDLDFRSLLQEQADYLTNVIVDGQAIVNKKLYGLEQGNIDYFVTRKDLLEEIVFERWDEISQKLKSKGFSNIPELLN